MGMLKEFKEFALRGNVVDMAVGVVIGAAFGKIVSSLVTNVIMPPIGYLLGGIDFSNHFFPKAPAKEVRKCPFCREAIADDATRCPHCTAVIDDAAAAK